VALDNFGSRVTGRTRLGATLSYLDPFAHGDVLSVSLLTSGNNMKYGRMSYDTLLNGSGTRTGGAYSSVHYVLGDTLADLNGHGTANAYNLWVKHPLVRSPNFNLYAQLQYDHKALDDRIDVAAMRTQRLLGNKVFSISGDARDKLLSGSASMWNLTYTAGKVAFDDVLTQQSDAATAKTAGAFAKWTLNFTRMQGLTPSDSLYLNVTGQWARSNLDSAEKMIAGGVYSVRAYDVGTASGDSGDSETLELRHDFRDYPHGQWQAVAFIDSAHLEINRDPWATGTNTVALSGAGVGLNWLGPSQLSAKGYIAKPIGTIPDLLPATRSARAWLVVTKSF
jgi:hemolysin activation/secretion protein